MPFSGLARLAVPALMSAAGGKWLHSKGKQSQRNKAKSRVNYRRPLTKIPRAGVRPMSFPKQTLSRGLNKDFTYVYAGGIASPATQNTYGTEQVFKLNDPFDPTVGAEASQALYWDQFQALYWRYRVYAVTVELRFMTTNNTNIVVNCAKVGSSSDTTSTTSQEVEYVQEMPMTNVIRMSPGGEHTYLVGPQRYSMSYLEGESWLTRSDDYTAETSASPVLSPKLRVNIACRDSATAVTGYYDIRITYHTHLYNPKTPAESTGA